MADRDKPNDEQNVPRITEQGESPYPPPGPGETPAETEGLNERSDPDAAETTGVAWEELRKGLSPEADAGPDAPLFNERFTSQRQEVDQPNPHWEELDRKDAG